MSGEVITLGDGVLHVLANRYVVDGRVSWHAPSARGVATMNCYLLTGPDESLLVDTGLTIHEADVLAQIRGCLPQGSELSVMPLRQGEFDCMCNLAPILRELGARTVHAQFEDPLGWGNFRPEHVAWMDRMRGSPEIETRIATLPATMTLGARRLDLFRPQLRLLSTHWIFDHATRTLLTSDSFTYVVQPDASAAPVVTGHDDPTTLETVVEHLSTTRYWWLAGARSEPIRRQLADVFSRFDVEAIAPAYGSVLLGSDVVQRHYQLLDDALAELAA